ncbi:YcjF family protein [Suttonella ornithocola]|uniref:GTP-binding protein EngA n=1 Tax=Suttonella ornithocola TaxID=279832 RepID=A0A380MS31_9GAMM|nr:GTP-binding protein [Suttonella ornithocola]SUO95400.1 GTP-binding protein EngA [Suttonella ornithocola]
MNNERGQNHLGKARDSLSRLLEDKRLPGEAKARLSEDFRQLQRLLDKLEKGHVHVAAFGRVSVGKSALLNALAGKTVFETSVLHGHTKHSAETLWQSFDTGGVYLLDTPGIDEVNGEERAKIADNVARQADVILFVVDGDMTDIEYEALFALHQETQPIILVLNKADRYSAREQEALLKHLRHRVAEMVPSERVVVAAAQPDKQLEIIERENGSEEERWVMPEPRVEELRQVLWQLLQAGGQSYAALNASVFAGRMSEKIGMEIIEAKRSIAEKIIRQYALFKSIGVAINPIPAVDLLALAADSGMVVHLSKVYGVELTRHEAGSLIRTIAVQTGMLMGTVYGIQVLSSVLKGLTGGLSTIITAGAQAGVAFYGSYVVGKAAQQYFAQGASWGEGGAKRVIEEIMADLDKDQLMSEAKASVQQLLKKGKK